MYIILLNVTLIIPLKLYCIPQQWIHSYTTLTDCYSVVNKEHTDEIIGKPRSFSTIIGSLSPTDSIFPLSNVPAVLKEELSDDEHEIS